MKKFFVLLVAIALSTMLYAAKGGEQGSSHGQPFLTLQGQIDKLVGDADSVEERLAGLESATEILEDDVEDLNADLDGLHTEVSQLRGYVSDNTDNINKNLGYIIEIHEVIELTGDEIATTLGALDTMAEYTIASLEAIAAALEEHASAIEANHILIESMLEEIESLKVNMELKQNIIDGRCPAGQAIVGGDEGELICEAVSGDLLQTVRTKWRVVGAGDVASVSVECPAGSIMSGGGFVAAIDFIVLRNTPTNTNAWEVEVKSNKAWPFVFSSSAVCLKLQ